MAKQPPRSTTERQADARAVIDRDVDVWVASASPDGQAHLVPLSFAWDGADVTISVDEGSVTARNITAAGRARLGFGATRDVVMVDAALVSSVNAADADDAVVDRYAARTGWNPRTDGSGNLFLTLRPQRIQAWREANELAGRTVMRDGSWVE